MNYPTASYGVLKVFEYLESIIISWMMYAFTPRQSLVRNIGADESGTNFTTNEHYSYNVELINQVNVERIHLSESPLARQNLKRFYLDGKISTKCHITSPAALRK